MVLNGVSVKRNIPTSWDDVSFKAFLDLESCGNDEAKMLALFTGLDESTVRKAQVKEGIDVILSALSFLRKPDYNRPVPAKILGYTIPKNLQFESMDQYADVKQIVDKGLLGRELLGKYPEFCAIYATKPYVPEQADAKISEFLNAPCTEVLAVGNFTFLKLIELSQTTPKSSHKLLTALKNWKLALKLWWIRLASTVRFYIWKRKQDIKEAKS